MPLPPPVTRFVIELETALPPAEAWHRLWDLARHTAAVPLTTVSQSDGDALGDGARFVARTSLGPYHLDDAMVVDHWDPPRRATVRKTGRWLTGEIEAVVVESDRGSRVTWTQSFGARWVPDRLAALARPAVRAGYAATLRQILG